MPQTRRRKSNVQQNNKQTEEMEQAMVGIDEQTLDDQNVIVTKSPVIEDDVVSEHSNKSDSDVPDDMVNTNTSNTSNSIDTVVDEESILKQKKKLYKCLCNVYGKETAKHVHALLSMIAPDVTPKKKRAPTEYNLHLAEVMRSLKGRTDLTKKDKMGIVSQQWKIKTSSK